MFLEKKNTSTANNFSNSIIYTIKVNSSVHETNKNFTQ